MSATSSSNAWAVGSAAKGPLTVHWNGTSWTKVPSPGPATATLTAVDAVSATDAWALGGTTKPYIIHWNGKAWTQTAVPSLAGAFLDSISATSPSNAWAVGSYATRTGQAPRRASLILHWNGKAWTQFATPNVGNSELVGVSALSGSVAWAVGALVSLGGPSGDLILRWNGKGWSRVAGAPAEADSVLTGVAATSAGNAWIVGGKGEGGPQGGLRRLGGLRAAAHALDREELAGDREPGPDRLRHGPSGDLSK